MISSKVTSCALCEGSHFTPLWELPRLPLTEKYGPFTGEESLFHDQTLLFCERCGHVQLGAQIDPKSLYTPSAYAFRTTASKTALEGSSFFSSFVDDVAQGRSFKSLLDIGGNGLWLAQNTHQAKEKVVVDPVCSSQEGKTIEGVKILGRFIEEIDFEKERLYPDLLFCRHVLEHIAQPKELLSSLFEQASPDALYIFEIPCFSHLIEASRFDAIFHQHYHYFDLFSLKRLLEVSGGKYLSHRFNPRGSCGGALLIAFTKGEKSSLSLSQVELSERKNLFLLSIEKYKEQMSLLSWQLKKFQGATYGYGASLMLATLGYHLGTDFSELICVLDDDPNKEGISYQNVPVQVHTPETIQPKEHANFLITSLENVRTLYSHITSRFKPKRILVPMII